MNTPNNGRGEPFVEEDYPHGLVCAECDAPFLEGESLYRVEIDPTEPPVCLIVCAGCCGFAS